MVGRYELPAQRDAGFQPHYLIEFESMVEFPRRERTPFVTVFDEDFARAFARKMRDEFKASVVVTDHNYGGSREIAYYGYVP